MAKGRPWRTYELEYLRQNWPKKTDAEIAAALSRTETAVKTMRYHNGIRSDGGGWDREADVFIRENWRTKTDAEMGAHLGRAANEVYQRGLALGLGRRKDPERRKAWSQEDIEYLAEYWGIVSIQGLCKKLGRTQASVLTQKTKLGLGAFLNGGEYVTLNQLLIAVTGSKTSYSYKMKSWVENRGLPVHNKRNNRCTFRVVYIDEFWEWAEKNRSFIDFSKMEPLILGEEPDWVSAQRKKDFRAFAAQRKDPWTALEDDRLKSLLKMHRYGYAELSKMLTRSTGAIQRRICDLGLKERPVKADNHTEWTLEDYNALADGIRAGDSYSLIGDVIGRSEKAIRGKVYYVYFTENADKIRAMMGDGEWGDGAPEPTVKQALHHSQYRKDLLQSLATLAGLIAYRRNELGYEPYWQRHMCMKWHDVKGCAAGCDNCDTCIEFERIRPQYCARCGGTFFERTKNTFCTPCRRARKKKYQRRYAAMAAKGAF